jgi:hypothetical protein
MLVVSPSSVAALHYKDFSAPLGQTRFIEEESVPPDTKVIGQTWRYVNKSGGPDRRLPICLYGEMAFVSSSGLNGLLHFSNPTAADRFAKVSEVLRGFDRSVSESKAVKSIRTPRHWPSILFWILFLTGALAIGIPALLKLSNSEYQAKLPNLLNFEPMSLPAKTEQPTKSQTIERATQNGTTPSRPTVITPSSSIPRVDQSKTQPVTAVPLPRPRPKPSSQN